MTARDDELLELIAYFVDANATIPIVKDEEVLRRLVLKTARYFYGQGQYHYRLPMSRWASESFHKMKCYRNA